MSITFKKRQKEMKPQEKQRAKAKWRGQKRVAKRAAKEAQNAPTTAPSGPEPYFLSEVNQKTLGSGPTIILSVPIDPRSSVAPGTRHFESHHQPRTGVQPLNLHQRSGALAKLLKRHFQRTKFLRAQFR